MVKETRPNLSPLFLLKHHHRLFLKFAVSFLLLGIACLLFTHSFFTFSSMLLLLHTPPPLPNAMAHESPLISFPSQPPESVDFPGNQSQSSPNALRVSLKVPSLKLSGFWILRAGFLLFCAAWVPDLSGPMYTNESCHVVEDHQNCMRNGRPDSGYLYWRWNPRGCELAKFSPTKFLDIMRDKSWAFMGDSISRNHVQSLLCILSQVEAADEVYHDEEYRSKIWKFPSYNFTLSVIWTPFLIKADTYEDMNGVSSSEIQLYLDILDNKWTSQYKNFDYVVIAGGKWFLKTAIYHENSTVTGCHNCHGKNLTELGFKNAYSKALQQVFNFVANSRHKAVVFFRTTTPDHFENGEWFSGGYCNRTVPLKRDEINVSSVDSTMRSIEVEEFDKAKTSSLGVGAKLKLLDTTQLSVLRPDGHPGPYRQFHPLVNAEVQNDCLHWCLPGPIDSWNDILMQMLSM